MTRIIIAITALSMAALSQASPASAQDRWGFELSGHGAVASQDAARDSHKNGFGFDGTVQYRFLPHLAAYAGWGLSHFRARDAIAGPKMDMEETGYVLGLRFEHPLRDGGRTAFWVRAGGMYGHLELENADGDVVADSGHGLGWEAAAGLALPLAPRWSLTPGIRYRFLSRDLEINSRTVPVELQATAFEIGILRRF
jgi:hypothetical protein